MTPMNLIQASSVTRGWLLKLREILPELKYTESKYWAKFQNAAGKAVARLNPSKRGMRLFLPLDPDGAGLEPSPSSKAWGDRFPSVFRIAREEDLDQAGQLIAIAAAETGLQQTAASPRGHHHLCAEEVSSDVAYPEGAVQQITVNAYERNQEAREACLEHYGRSCVVCGFNFLRTYGSEAADYIQVHHTKPIARAGGTYVLNPIKDLRPVCPNCHAVIHRRDPPFEIVEVKRMLRKVSAQWENS